MIQNKGIEDLCNTSLGLGLGRTWMDGNEAKDGCKIKKPQLNLHTPSRSFEPSLTLGLPDETDHQSSPQSDVSSFSDTRVKRERELGSVEMTEERMCRRVLVCDDDEEVINARKKLRLTKEQSAFLEESFKGNSTLNPKQKLALAKSLNLRPRQVEVWFQNRRARTKLKQTEIDYEYLKKYCEALKHENKRLQKEVHELKIAPKLYMHVPAEATRTVCPSCESSKGSYPVAEQPHLHKSYNQSSAAC